MELYTMLLFLREYFPFELRRIACDYLIEPMLLLLDDKDAFSDYLWEWTEEMYQNKLCFVVADMWNTITEEYNKCFDMAKAG